MSIDLNNINLAILGDISLNGIISTQPELNETRFSEVSTLLNKASLVFANLEMPIESHEKNANKTHHHFTSRNVTKHVLTQLNVSCVSLANNHVYDCKHSGLRATIELLDEIGIKHTGAGWLREQIAPAIIEKGNIKIGFLAYVSKSTNPKTEEFQDLFINYFETEKVLSDIKLIRDSVDIIICSIHWGIDYSSYFTLQQQIAAKAIIDSGVDIIMGHHPHTIQPFEIYKEKHIFYSLGGICFGDFYRNNKLSAIKRKTKLGMVAFTNFNVKDYLLVPTKDLPGNKIVIPKVNILKKLKRLGWFNRIKNKNRFANSIISFNEVFIDRINEYLFGYYRSPLKQLFGIMEIRKFNYIIRDFKKAKQ